MRRLIKSSIFLVFLIVTLVVSINVLLLHTKMENKVNVVLGNNSLYGTFPTVSDFDAVVMSRFFLNCQAVFHEVYWYSRMAYGFSYAICCIYGDANGVPSKPLALTGEVVVDDVWCWRRFEFNQSVYLDGGWSYLWAIRDSNICVLDARAYYNKTRMVVKNA